MSQYMTSRPSCERYCPDFALLRHIRHQGFPGKMKNKFYRELLSKQNNFTTKSFFYRKVESCLLGTYFPFLDSTLYSLNIL